MKQCTKMEVPVNRRPCFECNETGHIARNCQKRNSTPGKAVAEAEAPQKTVFSLETDWQMCTRGTSTTAVAAARRPHRATVLGDFLSEGNFAKLLRMKEPDDEPGVIDDQDEGIKEPKDGRTVTPGRLSRNQRRGRASRRGAREKNREESKAEQDEALES